MMAYSYVKFKKNSHLLRHESHRMKQTRIEYDDSHIQAANGMDRLDMDDCHIDSVTSNSESKERRTGICDHMSRAAPVGHLVWASQSIQQSGRKSPEDEDRGGGKQLHLHLG
jgi:hypothetical protein